MITTPVNNKINFFLFFFQEQDFLNQQDRSEQLFGYRSGSRRGRGGNNCSGWKQKNRGKNPRSDPRTIYKRNSKTVAVNSANAITFKKIV